MTPREIPLNKVAIGIVIGLSMILATGCFEGYIGDEGAPLQTFVEPEDLLYLVQNPELYPNIFIIDVRPESAYNSGHIPSALSFPSSTIMSRLTEHPLNDPDNNYILLY